VTASGAWYTALRHALDQAADEPELVKRAAQAAQIQRDLAQGSEEAAAIYRRAIEKLKESDMSYGQISAALAIARGTVQGHAEHSRRTGLVPGLIFAIRDQDGRWYPDPPEAILPHGPYATGDSIKIRADRPSRFAGRELLCAYEDTPSGRIPDDSPGYAYLLTRYGRPRRTTRAVHDAIWEPAQ
jgi:hypothetical protein